MAYLNAVLVSDTVTEEPMDGVKCAVLNNSLFILGGWNGFQPSPMNRNTQYVTSNGTDFTKLANADWSPRHTFICGETKDYIYVIGADHQPECTATHRKEVWRTNNPAEGWELLTNNAEFGIHDRATAAGCVTPNGDIFVGGGNGTAATSYEVYQDLWRSIDGGYTFHQIGEGLTMFKGNDAGTMIWYNNALYKVCGGKYSDTVSERTYTKEFWRSTDGGFTWVRLDDFPGVGRQYLDMAVWDNKLWLVAGGQTNGTSGYNLSDIWYYNGAGWARVIVNSLYTTHATGVHEFMNRLYICCGNLWQQVHYIEHV
jgi:hypothetical protein